MELDIIHIRASTSLGFQLRENLVKERIKSGVTLVHHIYNSKHKRINLKTNNWDCADLTTLLTSGLGVLNALSSASASLSGPISLDGWSCNLLSPLSPSSLNSCQHLVKLLPASNTLASLHLLVPIMLSIPFPSLLFLSLSPYWWVDLRELVMTSYFPNTHMPSVARRVMYINKEIKCLPLSR